MDNTAKVEALLHKSVKATFKKAAALFGDPDAQTRITEAFTEASRIWGGEIAAKQWLLEKTASLGGQIPLCLSGESAEGHKNVLKYLGIIEFGTYG
ncbi:MAG: antitoxin Xre/MbcA/ParS toxin-binding domain-containing protein [Alphaproteobacteria bacterium]